MQEIDNNQETILTPEHDLQSAPETGGKEPEKATDTGSAANDAADAATEAPRDDAPAAEDDKHVSQRHQAKASELRPRRWVAAVGVIGVLCAIAAWVTFFYNDTAAVTTASIGLVCSIIGCFRGRGCFRDICITMLVATSVLLLVYTIFYIGMDYVMSLM